MPPLVYLKWPLFMSAQIYLTSVEKLVKAPIWERQRILRPERAMAIAEDRMKKAQQQVRTY
jgi:heme exporter protein D